MKMTEEKGVQFERTVPFFELEEIMKKYDIIIVGAGASGVFMSYELAKLDIDARCSDAGQRCSAGKAAVSDQERRRQLPQV